MRLSDRHLELITTALYVLLVLSIIGSVICLVGFLAVGERVPVPEAASCKHTDEMIDEDGNESRFVIDNVCGSNRRVEIKD